MKKVISFFEENYMIFLVYAFLGWLYEELWFLIMRHEIVNRGFLYGPFLPVYGFGILVLLLFLRRAMSKKHLFGDVLTIPIGLFVVNFIYITYIEYTHDRIYQVSKFLSMYGLLELMISVITVIVLYFISKKIKESKFDLTPFLVFIIIFVIATVVEFIAHYILDTYFDIMLWDYSKDFLNIDKRICFDASRNFAILGTFAMYAIQPFLDKGIAKMKVQTKHIVTLVFFIPMVIDFILSILK